MHYVWLSGYSYTPTQWKHKYRKYGNNYETKDE